MINVIGLGYIGLPTALMFAAHGESVVGTDCNKDVVEKLKMENIDSQENGLRELFTLGKKNIKFSNDYISTDMYIISVPTPYDKNTKKIDPSYVVDAVKKIVEICLDNAVVVIESTISPGTIDVHIRNILAEQNVRLKKKLNIVHAPERIIPGNMINELKYNARVIGADDKNVAEFVKKKYASFCRGEIVTTDIKTAEMTKVVENTYRDVNIAFANELSKICRLAEIDVHEVIRIANMHPRVSILQPGPGVGGHCIAVDPWFLVGDYPQVTKVVLAARQVNSSMPEFVLNRISDIMLQHNIRDVSRLGLYGMTYKENIDDVRESPTLQLIELMNKNLAFGASVYDPFVNYKLVENQVFNFDEFLGGIDILVVMVAHDEILHAYNKVEDKIILDTKNVLKNKKVYKL